MDQAETNSFSGKVSLFLEKQPVIYQFMRFACIGFLNAGLHFIILNALSKALGVSQGINLGLVSAAAFSVAVVQSYLWNRVWTFGGERGVGLRQNVTRLLLVGFVGVFAVILVIAGSSFLASWIYYAGVLLAYLVLEALLWRKFNFYIAGFHHKDNSFIVFFIATLIGLGINFLLTSFVSAHLHLTGTDLDKNIAVATAIAGSLFWNFLAYKIVVFKK